MQAPARGLPGAACAPLGKQMLLERRHFNTTDKLERRHFNWLTGSVCASDICRDIHKRSERILMSRDTGSTLTS